MGMAELHYPIHHVWWKAIPQMHRLSPKTTCPKEAVMGTGRAALWRGNFNKVHSWTAPSVGSSAPTQLLVLLMDESKEGESRQRVVPSAVARIKQPAVTSTAEGELRDQPGFKKSNLK